VLRIEDEEHAVAATEEDVPAVFACVQLEPDNFAIESLNRFEIGRVQAALEYAQRLHGEWILNRRRRAPPGLLSAGISPDFYVKPVSGPSPQ
jgi:hypothetical protein